jgi:hypothetical protein
MNVPRGGVGATRDDEETTPTQDVRLFETKNLDGPVVPLTLLFS